MYISDQYKFIFIHNPKCGGHTIEHLIKPYSNIGHHRVRDRDPNKLNFFRHDAAAAVHHYFDKFEEYYSFSTIRNPWDRIVSFFYFNAFDKYFIPYYAYPEDQWPLIQHNPTCDWNKWILEAIYQMRELKSEWDWDHLAVKNVYWRYGKTQDPWTINKIAEITGYPRPYILCSLWPYLAQNMFYKNGRLIVNRIIRLEDFDKELSSFLKVLIPDIQINEIPQCNQSIAKRDYRDYFNSYTRQQIGKLFERDIEIGKYRF